MALLAVYHPLLLAFDLCLILTLLLIIFLWGRGCVETAVKESRAKLDVGNWLHALAADPKQYTTNEGHNRAIYRADELATVNAVPIVRHRADEKCGSWLILGFISKLGQRLSPRTPPGPVGTGA